MSPICYPETSVSNHYRTLSYIPEQCRSLLMLFLLGVELYPKAVNVSWFPSSNLFFLNSGGSQFETR